MKYFKVFLSNRQEVALDEADYEKLLAGMASGSFVRLKKAVLNPSFISHILPIAQNEALAGETTDCKINGYVDEERGVYVITDKGIIPTTLKDEFANETPYAN